MIPEEIDHEELTPAVIKYMMRELSRQMATNHSEYLTKFGNLEGKVDSINKTLNSIQIENVKEHTCMQKDIASNREMIGNAIKALYGVGIVLVGGIINMFFGLFGPRTTL